MMPGQNVSHSYASRFILCEQSTSRNESNTQLVYRTRIDILSRVGRVCAVIKIEAIEINKLYAVNYGNISIAAFKILSAKAYDISAA